MAPVVVPTGNRLYTEGVCCDLASPAITSDGRRKYVQRICLKRCSSEKKKRIDMSKTRQSKVRPSWRYNENSVFRITIRRRFITFGEKTSPGPTLIFGVGVIIHTRIHIHECSDACEERVNHRLSCVFERNKWDRGWVEEGNNACQARKSVQVRGSVLYKSG